MFLDHILKGFTRVLRAHTCSTRTRFIIKSHKGRYVARFEETEIGQFSHTLHMENVLSLGEKCNCLKDPDGPE